MGKQIIIVKEAFFATNLSKNNPEDDHSEKPQIHETISYQNDNPENLRT